MKTEEIFNLWKEDSEIDKTEISDESIKVAKLHHKYYQIYISEKIQLRQVEAEFKKLKLEKHEFYNSGPSEETQAKGWKFPGKVILKGDIPMYMDADDDIIKITLRIGILQEKIELLDSILKMISNRGYILNTILNWHKFTAGG